MGRSRRRPAAWRRRSGCLSSSARGQLLWMYRGVRPRLPTPISIGTFLAWHTLRSGKLRKLFQVIFGSAALLACVPAPSPVLRSTDAEPDRGRAAGNALHSVYWVGPNCTATGQPVSVEVMPPRADFALSLQPATVSPWQCEGRVQGARVLLGQDYNAAVHSAITYRVAYSNGRTSTHRLNTNGRVSSLRTAGEEVGLSYWVNPSNCSVEAQPVAVQVTPPRPGFTLRLEPALIPAGSRNLERCIGPVQGARVILDQDYDSQVHGRVTYVVTLSNGGNFTRSFGLEQP